MKTLLLIFLTLCGPAYSQDKPLAMRIYAQYKIAAVELEPDGVSVFIRDRLLKGRCSMTARGSTVQLESGSRSTAKSFEVTAYGRGLWLSGKGVPRRLYRGKLVFTAESGQLKIINTLPLETYLAGVVSGEVSDLSQEEAFRAQAVAARTYTVTHMYTHLKEGYNLCDSPHCQLYSGEGDVSPQAQEATDATRGELLYYHGSLAQTYYHSICGGRTEKMSYVWPVQDKPYLISVRDGPAGRPYCSIAPDFNWKTKIYFTGLTRIAREAGWIGRTEEARGLRISAWGASGRAAKLDLYTRSGRVPLSATDFYHGIGRRAGWFAVKSTFFRIYTGKDYIILVGVGSGHGVGMCQWGAEGMAREGFKYREILKHYYPGTEIRND